MNPGQMGQTQQPQVVQTQQDFRKPGPLVSQCTGEGPRSKTTGVADQSSQMTAYDVAYAQMIQNDRAAHNGQLRIDLVNSGDALERARAKKLEDTLRRHGQGTL